MLGSSVILEERFGEMLGLRSSRTVVCSLSGMLLIARFRGWSAYCAVEVEDTYISPTLKLKGQI